MSAFILEDDSIDLLVTAGIMGVGIDGGLRVFQCGASLHFTQSGDGADEVGAILKTENVASVNYRYNESKQATPYRYSGSGITPYLGGKIIPWGQVLKTVRCYEYQSCEHPEWNGSLAKAICEAITQKVCARIADECDAEWNWRREYANVKLDAVHKSIAGIRQEA